jgi:integrase/recombinase XerD
LARPPGVRRPQVLYGVTLGRPGEVSRLPFPKHRPSSLPKVLTADELSVFFAAIRKAKYRALFMTCYAAGLRLGEACHLRVEDIDSQRMVVRVRTGKGGRERLTVLSPRLLEVLRAYWRLAKPSVWLFPGATPARPVALDTARSVFHRARVARGDRCLARAVARTRDFRRGRPWVGARMASDS